MNDQYYRDPRVAQTYDHDIQPSRDVVTDDIPFYVGLAREAAALGLPVLELGCGTGRVTIPIAAAGVDVTGLDSSQAMLDVARAKTRGLDNPGWVEANMADFHLDKRFGLVIIPFRSFLLLLTVEEQKACLRCVHEHLLEGGRLALNFFNPDLVLMARSRSRNSHRLQRVEEVPIVKAGHNVRQWERTEYLMPTQSLDWTRRREELSGQGAVITRIEKTLRLRHVFRYEMEHLLTLADLTVEALYGWFDRRPFDETSSEMVWLARRGA